MPFYVYTNEDESVVEELFVHDGMSHPENIPATIEYEVRPGETVTLTRNIASTLRGHTKSQAKWPKRCDASGVSDDLIDVTNQEIAQKGLTGVRCITDGQDKGCMEYDSPTARHKYLRFAGLKDRSSWYG